MIASKNSLVTERYERDGIVFPIPVLSMAEVERCRSALDSITELCGEGSLKRFDNLHLFFPWAHKLATHEALLDSVEDFLGPDLVIDGRRDPSLEHFRPARFD